MLLRLPQPHVASRNRPTRSARASGKRYEGMRGKFLFSAAFGTTVWVFVVSKTRLPFRCPNAPQTSRCFWGIKMRMRTEKGNQNPIVKIIRSGKDMTGRRLTLTGNGMAGCETIQNGFTNSKDSADLGRRDRDTSD